MIRHGERFVQEMASGLVGREPSNALEDGLLGLDPEAADSSDPCRFAGGAEIRDVLDAESRVQREDLLRPERGELEKVVDAPRHAAAQALEQAAAARLAKLRDRPRQCGADTRKCRQAPRAHHVGQIFAQHLDCLRAALIGEDAETVGAVNP